MTDIIFPSILHVMCTIIGENFCNTDKAGSELSSWIAVKRFSSDFPSAGRSPLALLEKKDQGRVANPDSHWHWQLSVKIKLFKEAKNESRDGSILSQKICLGCLK